MLYLSYYLTHKTHLHSTLTNDYHQSIIKMFSLLNGKTFLFITDTECYTYIKDYISIWDKCKIIVLPDGITGTNTFNKYYSKVYDNLKMSNNYCSLSFSTDEERASVAKTLMIWHYKFELLTLCISNNIDNQTHVCFLDGGIFRDGRMQYVRDFANANFYVKDINKFVINHTRHEFESNINLDYMYKTGAHEIGCNHMLFSIDILEKLYTDYCIDLDNLINTNILTTEQRVFTTTLRRYYISNPEWFTFKQQNRQTYTVAFHM